MINAIEWGTIFKYRFLLLLEKLWNEFDPFKWKLKWHSLFSTLHLTNSFSQVIISKHFFYVISITRGFAARSTLDFTNVDFDIYNNRSAVGVIVKRNRKIYQQLSNRIKEPNIISCQITHDTNRPSRMGQTKGKSSNFMRALARDRDALIAGEGCKGVNIMTQITEFAENWATPDIFRGYRLFPLPQSSSAT